MGPGGDADITEIPNAEVFEPSSQVAFQEDVSVVFFDLETTGFGNDTEIVQIAATHESDSFESYILPRNPMHPKAAEVTQLYSTGCKLYHKGQPVKTETMRTAITNFIKCLPKNALLLAHNCKNFDAYLLVSHVNGIDELGNFNSKVLGFSDSLPLVRDKIPNRKSYSQTSLVVDILSVKYDAHNAKEDVSLLNRLLTAMDVKSKELFSHSFTTEYVQRYLDHSRMKRQNLITFNGVIREKVISKKMSEKAAASGLTFNHIKAAFQRNGSDGVFAVLGEFVNINGKRKPRVTNQKSILHRICNYLSK